MPSGARLLTVGFDGLTLGDPLKRLLDAGVGGVILFRRNLSSRAQAAELIGRIKEYAPQPVVLCVDQEGGLVQRLRDGFTRIPPMREIGEVGDEDFAFRLGCLMGSELRAIGVDVDFAPVLDVDTNPDNPVIGNRAFSRDPETVARLGVALGRGLENAGVAACGKHFPGHGDTHLDSHLALPRLNHQRQRLDTVELVPFRAWARAGLAALMTAHVVFDGIEPDVPATLSHRVLTGLLRDELGFQGVVFSDDLEMKAIASHYGCESAALRAVAAGADNVLVCHDTELAQRIIAALDAESERDEYLSSRVQQSLGRVESFVARWSEAPGGQGNAQPRVEGSKLLAELAQMRLEDELNEGLDPTEIMTKF